MSRPGNPFARLGAAASAVGALVAVSAAFAGPPSPCDPCIIDTDRNGSIDAGDLAAFMTAFDDQRPEADIDGDGAITGKDVSDFIAAFASGCAMCERATIGVPIVFVSRAIPGAGHDEWSVPRLLPGVGPYSRCLPAAPGRLQVREPDGSIRTLIDGAAPSAESMWLVDVNGPAVAHDGRRIVFSGLTQLAALAAPGVPMTDAGGWRLFAIDADGSGLQQLTFSDQERLDLSQFGPAAAALFGTYDDFDPVVLPDGRIAFASTRWYSFAQYAGARTSNIHVMNADGSRILRLTAERSGAERPLVDPVTGRIVYSRWWRNHRLPAIGMGTIPDPSGGYIQHQGLTTDPDLAYGGASMLRNGWHAATMITDGSSLSMFAGTVRSDDANFVYGGAFAPNGVLYSAWFPDVSLSHASGFGGIRRIERGAAGWSEVIGASSRDPMHPYAPDSGIPWGRYACDPEVLPDGRLLISWAPNVHQDYGLYAVNPDGSGFQLVHDAVGTSELRARVLAPRGLEAIPKRDFFLLTPTDPGPPLLPPPEGAPVPHEQGQLFYSFNVYANAPVDVDISSAPPVGSASTIRFYLDHQRTSPGTFPALDWPIYIFDKPVERDGAIIITPDIPGALPIFEQLRGPAPGFIVPHTGGARPDGFAHGGLSFAPIGSGSLCVGCHAGHSMIPVAADPEDAMWSNLAPGATVTVSSSGGSDPANAWRGLVDRRVMRGPMADTWRSAAGQAGGQWVELRFPIPVKVRTVRLWGPRASSGLAGPGDEQCNVVVHAATVTLLRIGQPFSVAERSIRQGVSPQGTSVSFSDITADIVRVQLDQVSGTIGGTAAAALGEIEVVSRGH